MNKGTVVQVTDRNLPDLLGAPQAILILAKSGCGACARYQTEIEARLAQGELAGLAIGKLTLDQPGAPRFKRDNPWLADLRYLPYTVLYRDGQPIDGFAASKSSYLVERLDAAQTAVEQGVVV